MDSSASEIRRLGTLIHRANERDDEAFGELIDQVAGRLQRMSRMMLRNYPHLRRWEQTDDVLQNAVIRLHRSLSRVRPESVRQFFGLAATQIRRTLIDLLRHHFGPQGHAANYQSDVAASREDGRVETAPSGPDSRSRPESLEDWASFHEAAETLPADEREVFDLTWYGGLQQSEIASVIGVSIPTVQRRWQRARTLMRDALQSQAPHVEET